MPGSSGLAWGIAGELGLAPGEWPGIGHDERRECAEVAVVELLQRVPGRQRKFQGGVQQVLVPAEGVVVEVGGRRHGMRRAAGRQRSLDRGLALECGTPVPEAAPTTEENTRYGSRTAMAAPIIA